MNRKLLDMIFVVGFITASGQKMIRLKLVSFLLIFSIFSFNLFGQVDTLKNEKLSKEAPVDKSHLADLAKQKKYEQMIVPYVEQALKTLPEAKQRFLNGLKEGEAFFLVTRIYDKEGMFEQVFVRVKKWDNDNINGVITEFTVKDFYNGQFIEFKEKDILDWMISKPDGSVEGNFIEKFLDRINK